MKSSADLSVSLTRSHATARRAELLEQFDRSGMSAAAFARLHQINYGTFCTWRYKRQRAKATVTFAEVEMSSSSAPELVVELGEQARMRITWPEQVELAAQLVRAFNSKAL